MDEEDETQPSQWLGTGALSGVEGSWVYESVTLIADVLREFDVVSL
jgi:hypothetical protein